ncbi:hypothetical protein AGDE_15584 [Angomonas deanei]|nr:hypothetical protein AGDE_15584 [Angomonas deanei]|eukprot:EPY18804.1 hypothetical protein AGDE_15584 [Angomonas deanei]
MTRHHNLYLPQEMSLNRKGGTESGKEEAIEKAYLLPTGLLQVHYHLLKHEKAEGSMDRLPEENATTSTKQETTEAKEEPKTKVKLSAVASLATVKLPTESFIDEILISVWDEVAIDREDLFKDSKEKYFAFSDTVVEAASKSSLPDNTRKRTTMRDGDGSATAVKTTPDNVAPAIKNRRDHFDRQSPHTPAAARRSVKEKRKDYPNPFGEYGSGIVQEEVVELDREPVNPFVAWEAEAKLTASGDSGTQDGGQSNDNNNNHNNNSGKDGRNFFHCPFCDPTNAPRYRLLDNLLDHIDEAHPSLTLTSEEVKEKIYKQDRVSRMYEGYTRDEATKEEEVEPEKDTSTDEEEGSLTATEVSPTVPEETPVHNRVCSIWMSLDRWSISRKGM